MSTSKLRGKSAVHINDSVISTNTSSSHNSLLKIESVVPKITARINNTNNLSHSNRLKTFHRSHSTLGTSYLKKAGEKKLFVPRENVGDQAGESSRDQQHPNRSEPQPDGSVLVQNGITTIKRSERDREKHPDRVNLDRKGLGSIPIIDDEPNLRLLSLQHNLINTFHIPAETDSNNNETKSTAHNSPVNSVNLVNQNQTKSTVSVVLTATANNTNKEGFPTNSTTATATASSSPFATSHNIKQFLRQKSTSRNQLYMNSNNINYLTSKVTLGPKPVNGLTPASNGQSPTSATSPTSTFLQKPSSIPVS